MDILLLFIGFILVIAGIIGSILPILPGPLASWVGLVCLYFTKPVTANTSVLWISFLFVIAITVLDNFIPAIGAKKFGGTKSGMRGSIAGAILGIFLGPIGIITGPFIGAFVGELLADSRDTQRAFRAAIGSFIGFLLSTGIKLFVCFTLLTYFFQAFWPVRGLFF